MAFMSGPGAAAALGGQPRGDEIASYDNYLQAQRAVDFLSDSDFPVRKVTIVGTELRMIERIIGRRTYATAAMQGAGSGLMLGVFFGLMFSLLGAGTVGIFAIFLPAVLIGAAFGILWGVLGHALTGGRRDFNSTSQVLPTTFAVLCLSDESERARQLLTTMPADPNTGADTAR